MKTFIFLLAKEYFLSIFSALKKIGYQETVTVEVPHKHLKSSVQKLREIVESIID